MSNQPQDTSTQSDSFFTYRDEQFVGRVAASVRKSLIGFRQRPNPPRGLRFSDSTLQWEPPIDPQNVTHYRIYADTENNLVRQVPVGQLFLSDNLTADRVFVAAFNENSGLESIKIGLEQSIAPPGFVPPPPDTVPTVSISTDTTVDAIEQTVEVDTSLGAVNVTLPPLAGWLGLDITIIKTSADANSVTWLTTGADRIDGASSGTLTDQWQSVTIRATETAKGIIVSSSATASPVSSTPAGDVSLGTPTLSYIGPDQQGRMIARITVPFTAPGPIGTWDHVNAYLLAPDDAFTLSKAVVTPGVPSGDVGFFVGGAGSASNIVPNFLPIPFGPFHASENAIVVQYPAPNVTELWRIYAVSGSRELENTLVPFGALGASPSVTISVDPAPTLVSGAEYCQNADSFVIDSVEYRVADGGVNQWRFNAHWTFDTSDPRYALLGGADLTITGPDGVTSLISSPSKNDPNPYAGDWWNVPDTPTSYVIRFVSWDVNARRNAIVFGVTPSATIVVQRPAGGVGEEYTILVASPTALVEYALDGDGGEIYRIALTWIPPTDPTYGGCTPTLRWTSESPNRDVPLGDTGSTDVQLRTSWFPIAPGGSGTFDVYFVSFDSSSRPNTLVPGVTPVVASVNVVYQTTGKIKGNRVDAATLAAALAVNAGLLGVAPGGITNTLVADGAIDTPKLTTNEISIGGAGSKPIRFRIYDHSGNPIAWIGDDTANSGFVGAWFKQIYIGGTGPAAAPFQVDNSGKLSISLTSANVGSTAFSLNLGGITTTISNVSSLSGLAGMKVADNSTNKYGSYGVDKIYLVTTSSQAGVLIQYNGSAGEIFLNETSGANGLQLSGTLNAPLVKGFSSFGNFELRTGSGGGAPQLLMSGLQVLTTRQTGPGNTTDVTDVATRFNSLLSVLRTHGICT